MPIPEGEYFIQNAQSEKYVDTSDACGDEFTVIQQWEYHAGNHSKWRIEYIDSTFRYIVFESVAFENMYIGVDRMRSAKAIDS